MSQDNSIKKWFSTDLAKLLSSKIEKVYPNFDSKSYIKIISQKSRDLEYTGRVELHADTLREYLPKQYTKALKIFLQILGPENPEETGMFKHFYWIMPIGKFIEKYGLDNFEDSLRAIEEVTKRSTGEYAIRPYLRTYPKETIAMMKKWSKSKNFHLRRLASEGCRPKLPWARKLEIFIEKPKPVFDILAILMEDEIKFVQKSVANNIADYLKVNKKVALEFIKKYKNSKNKNTQWILKHATRKIKFRKFYIAQRL